MAEVAVIGFRLVLAFVAGAGSALGVGLAVLGRLVDDADLDGPDLEGEDLDGADDASAVRRMSEESW